LTFEAFSERSAVGHNERMSLAWHTATLTRVDPKKFPKIDRLLIKTGPTARKQFQDPETRWRALTATASPKH
jgi:hypothetical protein